MIWMIASPDPHRNLDDCVQNSRLFLRNDFENRDVAILELCGTQIVKHLMIIVQGEVTIFE